MMMLTAWERALSLVGDPAALKTRNRSRRGYVREAKGYTDWDEVQVVEGRKVLWRAETSQQAEAFITEAKERRPRAD